MKELTRVITANILIYGNSQAETLLADIHPVQIPSITST